MDKLEYEGLKQYCKNEKQAEKLRLTFELGSMSAAARQLGLRSNAVYESIQVIRKEAARRGHSPDEKRAGLAAPGFAVKRRSTYYDLETGKPVKEWLITEPEKAQNWESLLQGIQDAASTIEGLQTPTKAPAHCDKDLLAIYPYGDPHIGMYAWNEDAEADFDLDTAVSLFTSATTDLVASAPPAEQALIAFLGDFFHSDNQSNRTARSGHQLDVDSRWSKVLRVGVNIAVSLIHLALTKHRKVHVICEIGNHDDHSAVMLAVCLDAFFRQDKRVTIDLSPARFHYYRFGSNLIGVHHGDLVKPNALPGVMANDRAEDWGQTTKRVWYTGHIHNQTRYDLAGCEVESFRILPPRDVYAQSNGYRSGRSMDCIIRHRDRGEIARHTVHA
jgi:hypothetical protein